MLAGPVVLHANCDVAIARYHLKQDLLQDFPE